MFAYCHNNPVNMSDESGYWPKWMKSKTFKKIAIGVAVIAAAAVVTVATGGAAAGTLLAAVHCVASGALVGAIVGAATGATKSVLKNKSKTGSWKGSGKAAVSGAANGFMKGSVTGAITGGISGVSSIAKASNVGLKASKTVKNDVVNLERIGSAIKKDKYHAFSDIIDNYAGLARKTSISNGGTLYQLEGALNGVAGRFEWIIQGGKVTHRMFVKGGGINGIPIMP